MNPDLNKLGNLAMWADWQERVKASLPFNFASNPIYVEQNSPSEVEFEKWAAWIKGDEIDVDGKMRDADYGARVVFTPSQGLITRMWLDSNVESKFLGPHFDMRSTKVLDIGAGYGRLAAVLGPQCASYTCVDAVPISTQISREYLSRHGDRTAVLDLETFKQSYRDLNVDLAINIHSFNECSLECIEAWLDCLDVMRVPYLFTVSHGQLSGTHETPYRSFGNGDPSFRPLLEGRYRLIEEKALGLGNHPHALWKLRK